MTDCVRPEEARKIVGAQHVTHPLPRVFVAEAEAEKAGVRYSFTELEGQSWSDRLAPRNPHKRKR